MDLVPENPDAAEELDSDTGSKCFVLRGAQRLRAVSYQWMLNGSALANATSSALTVVSAQATNSGSYTVAVVNPVGSITSQVATLNVNLPPGITAQPQNQAAMIGQSASFSVVATGTGSLSYQWYCNGISLGGSGGNATYTLNSVKTNNLGSYIVVVNNNYGSVTSAVATLTLPAAAGIITQPQCQSAVQGTNAVFSVVASGTAPFSYQWSLNGTNWPVRPALCWRLPMFKRPMPAAIRWQ